MVNVRVATTDGVWFVPTGGSDTVSVVGGAVSSNTAWYSSVVTACLFLLWGGSFYVKVDTDVDSVAGDNFPPFSWC